MTIVRHLILWAWFGSFFSLAGCGGSGEPPSDLTESDTDMDTETVPEPDDSDECRESVEQRVDEIMALIDALPRDRMIEVKCDQLRPATSWTTKTVQVDGLTIPGFRFADGPRGVGDGTTPAANGYAAGKATCYPARINQSQTWNLELIEDVNRHMSEEALASGVNVFLNAAIDLIRDPRVGRAQETVGEDPYLAGKVAVATIEGTQATGMIGNLKHYNLNYVEKGRGMITDIALGQVNDYLVDQRTLVEHYGLPFMMAIQEGNAMSVMAAYNKINGEKCTENPNLLTEILREQWDFKYWVIADWTANVSTVKAIHSGLDLDESLVVPSIYQLGLEADVRNGSISMDVLDTSVRRVLRSKLESGIMDH
jgi:beta-glucosidase